jgi:putative ABC transport system permease protein
MIPLWLLFARLILRPLLREPVRTALTVLAVALGVGVVIAIDLAGTAAAGSFHSSLEALAGRSDLTIRATGGIGERLLGRLAQLPYAFDFAPRIEDFASIDGKGEALPFLGLDLIREWGRRSLCVVCLSGSSRQTTNPDGLPHQELSDLTESDPIWVGARLGLRTGQRVNLLINDRLHEFRVAGVLRAQKGEIDEGNVIVADIGLAQAVAGKTGKLDSIDVRLPPGRNAAYWRKLLQRQLPPSVTVEPEGSRTNENRRMLAAFRWNLRILSYIALIVGAFLIYNTISISVVRRRPEIGAMRALGATRTMVRVAFIGESLFFGVLGSIAGLAIGRVMAAGAIHLVGTTVESLYVSSQPGPIQFTLGAVLTGLCVGIGITVLAALAPSWEASDVAPTEAMARGRNEYIVSTHAGRIAIWALVFLVAAAVCCMLPAVHGEPMFAYAGSMLLIASMAAAMPAMIALFVSTVRRTAAQLLGIEALLALQSLRGSLGRSTVLAAALATAVAMTASVGIMIGSLRETVRLWMNDELKADFYLRPAGSSAADRHPTMDAAVADRIQRLPGVAAVDRFRAYAISYQGLPATLGGGESAVALRSAGTRFLPGENRAAILRQLPTGDYAIVSEPFANKHRVTVGGTIRLALSGAERSFRVLGIYYDYSTERGFIVLDRHTLLKYLPDPRISDLAVYLNPGANADAVRRGIDEEIGGRAILLTSNQRLRKAAIAVFDRTFRITYALEAVAVIVAVMGIAGALLAMAIDRRREFAVLRFLGGERKQIRRIILCEAGLLGLLANGIGLAVGTLLSLILIFIINKQSFGWTIQFHWPVAVVLAALSVIYVATVLAGLYPARIAATLEPIEAIHEE